MMQSVTLSLFVDAGFCYFISLIQLNCWNVYVNDNNWIRSPHHHDICSERWIGRAQEERPSSWTCIAGVRSSQHLIELITSPLWLQASMHRVMHTYRFKYSAYEWVGVFAAHLVMIDRKTYITFIRRFYPKRLTGSVCVFPGSRTHNLLRC